MTTISRDVAVAANIQVHSALATTGEYNRSPHFRGENQAKVRAVLEGLIKESAATAPTRLLDVGCGTGFIVHLAHDLVDRVDGIDITDDMMSLIDTSSGNIYLQNARAEELPFDNLSFDFATAYSFLDHLTSYEDVFKEVHRVLKPGGVFYSDLNPSKHFSLLMEEMEVGPKEILPAIVSREIEGMLHNGEYWEQKFGIDSEAITNAEPIKSFSKGFDADEVVAFARSIGFSDARYVYDWYLGQAVVMHEQSFEQSALVEEYLRMALPATRGLFKYVRFIFVK